MSKRIASAMFVLVAALFFTVSNPLYANSISGSSTFSPGYAAVSSTLSPVADSFVRKDYANTNYGTFAEVRAQSSPLLISYLKFNVQGTSGRVTKATLRLYSLIAVSSGYKVYRVSDNSWGENSINYNNSPYLGTLIGASGAVSTNGWTSVDVTSYVTGNGTYSFGLTDPSATMIRLGSRESTNKPQLVIATDSSIAPTPVPTVRPTTVLPPAPTVGPTTTPPPASTNLLWSANMETGDKTQWNNGGGEFNSGTASSAVVRDVAHTGAYSLKMVTTTPPESAVRMFRWAESQTYGSLYYSTWYYFPRNYAVSGYWNIMQWKSKTSTGNDPFYTLNIGNNPDGSMRLYLYDWQRKQSYGQTGVLVAVGQWVHIEGFYKCAPDNTGRITIWQNGQQLFDVTGKSTRYSNGDCQWSSNNYSDSLSPSPGTIYIDDAGISQSFIP